MANQHGKSRVTVPLLRTLAPALCLLYHAALPAAGCRGDETPPPPAGNRAGQIAYLDPDTGELTSTPPPGTALPEAAQAQPVLPPVVEYVLPDGTVVADVGRRFMRPLRAEIVDGEVVICHAEATGEAGPPAGSATHGQD